MLFNMSEDEWDPVIETHLKGTFTVFRAAAPVFREQKSGTMIGFTSGAFAASVAQANYSAAKGGIVSLVRSAAAGMNKYGVTANCIAPVAKSRMSGNVPFGLEMGEPEDVAPMVAFLLSDSRARRHRPDLHGQRRPHRGVEPARRSARDAQGRPLDRRRDRGALRRGRPGTDADPRAARRRWKPPRRAATSRTSRHAMAPSNCTRGRVQAAVTLRADEYEATFLPGAAMLCTSLRHRGEEYVAWPRTLDDVPRRRDDRDPARTPVGQPARRLGLPGCGRSDVDLARPRPRRSTATACRSTATCSAPPFEIQRLEPAHVCAPSSTTARASRQARTPSRSRTRVDRRRAPRRARAPADDRGRADGRTRRCRSRSAGTRISDCPPADARDWVVRWPQCEHVEVDEHVIPTGARTPQPAERAPIGRRTFDDHYALGRDRRFSVEAARARAARSRSTATTRSAQLYVPPRREFDRDRADDRNASTRSAPARRRCADAGDRSTRRSRSPAVRDAAAPAAAGRVHRVPRRPLRAGRSLLGESHAGPDRRHVVSRPRRLVAVCTKRVSVTSCA